MLRKEARPPGALRSLFRRTRVESALSKSDLTSLGTEGTSTCLLGPEPPFSEPGIAGLTGRFEELRSLEFDFESVGGSAGFAVTGAVVFDSADIAGGQ